MDSPAAVLFTLHRQLYYPPFSSSCTIHPSAAAVLSTLQQLYYPPFTSCTIHPSAAAVLSTLHQLYCAPYTSCTVHPSAAVLSTLHQLYYPPSTSCTVHISLHTLVCYQFSQIVPFGIMQLEETSTVLQIKQAISSKCESFCSLQMSSLSVKHWYDQVSCCLACPDWECVPCTYV